MFAAESKSKTKLIFINAQYGYSFLFYENYIT